MSPGAGIGTAGKKRKKNASTRKHRAKMLTNMPARPRLNLLAGNCSFRRRLVSTDATQVMYEVKRPVPETERMMLNAAVDPMMMRARMHVEASVT